MRWVGASEAQPADEFERHLGEALEDTVDQRERLPGFRQSACLWVVPFLWTMATKCAGIAVEVVGGAQDFFSCSLVLVSSNPCSISPRVL